jgi:PAS domain S-box-containing protein
VIAFSGDKPVDNELEYLRLKVAELDGYKTRCEQLERALRQSEERFSITARQKEPEALRDSEEKYRGLIENSLQGLLIVLNGRIVFCNRAIAEISGYSIEELSAFEDSMVLIHEDDRPAIGNQHQDRLAKMPVSSHSERRIVRDASSADRRGH